MKLLLCVVILAVGFIVFACYDNKRVNASTSYDMSCSDLNVSEYVVFQRCENVEVVCYNKGYGLSCFRKDR